MVLDTFSFRFNQIIADVDISDEIVLQLFKLCTKHKLDIITDDLIYICKAIIETDFSDVKLLLSVEEDNPEIQSEYEAELSDELKNKIINDFKEQFLSTMDKAA